MPKAPDSGLRRSPKAWSGRLQQPSSPTLESYSTSLPWDRRLGQYDIVGSRAHAAALFRAGLIDQESLDHMLGGLEEIAEELSGGSFVTLESDEDIHMAVERRLTELVGEPGRRLHTGRSRNDQIAVDLRLYSRAACTRLVRAGAGFEAALLHRARQERGTLVPGYTHLQRGQPVHLGHHLLAYFEMISRDLERLRACHRRLNVSPLGAGALAGTTLPIGREESAAALGFAGVSANSLDAVSDRDFAVELTFCCALLGVHLSRLAEDLIIWNTTEFSFTTLPDAWATGSSLMPQKKNPDLLELVRGRSAVPIASLVGLLTLLKGLPLSYNRDLQEDKRHLFAAVGVAESSLLAFTGLLLEIEFQRAAMARASSDPELLATDLAERLVASGMPFRQAHEMVGLAVHRSREAGMPLDFWLSASWQELGLPFDPCQQNLFSARESLSRREQIGAPGPRATALALRRCARQLEGTRRWLEQQARLGGSAPAV